MERRYLIISRIHADKEFDGFSRDIFKELLIEKIYPFNVLNNTKWLFETNKSFDEVFSLIGKYLKSKNDLIEITDKNISQIKEEHVDSNPNIDIIVSNVIGILERSKNFKKW